MLIWKIVLGPYASGAVDESSEVATTYASGATLPPEGNIYFVAFGLFLLIIVALAIRYEIRYFSSFKTSPTVRVLSYFSFLVMILLSGVCIFHIFFDIRILVVLVASLSVLLLILTPILLVMRMRTFKELHLSRVEEKAKLMRDVTDILDDSKRKKFLDDVTPEGEDSGKPDKQGD